MVQVNPFFKTEENASAAILFIIFKSEIPSNALTRFSFSTESMVVGGEYAECRDSTITLFKGILDICVDFLD